MIKITINLSSGEKVLSLKLKEEAIMKQLNLNIQKCKTSVQ